MRRAARLMDCLGLLRSAHPPPRAASLNMRTLRHGLREGIGALLPAGEEDYGEFTDTVLIDGQGLLCAAVEDLGREHLVPCQVLGEYWPWARLKAEQEERQLFEEIRRLPPADYERVRTLLATHPAGDLDELLTAWGALWGRFPVFEPVAAWPWCNTAGWCFPCPRCHWPMRAQPPVDTVVSVSCDMHAAEGVQYACRPAKGGGRPQLEGVGSASPPVDGFPAAGDHLAVSRTVWRYLTLPSQMELQLRDALPQVTGLTIEMYPDDDRYDLRVSADDPLVAKEWRIDAKAWRSPAALAEALVDRPLLPGPVPVTIVVPHRQKAELPMLHERLASRPDLKVATDLDLQREIESWCRFGELAEVAP